MYMCPSTRTRGLNCLQMGDGAAAFTHDRQGSVPALFRIVTCTLMEDCMSGPEPDLTLAEVAEIRRFTKRYLREFIRRHRIPVVHAGRWIRFDTLSLCALEEPLDVVRTGLTLYYP